MAKCVITIEDIEQGLLNVQVTLDPSVDPGTDNMTPAHKVCMSLVQLYLKMSDTAGEEEKEETKEEKEETKEETTAS
jgi:hypothetical protein